MFVYIIIEQRPVEDDQPSSDPAPTYNPVDVSSSKPKYKKYGYKPVKPTNPTIWRQQVMKVSQSIN